MIKVLILSSDLHCSTLIWQANNRSRILPLLFITATFIFLSNSAELFSFLSAYLRSQQEGLLYFCCPLDVFPFFSLHPLRNHALVKSVKTSRDEYGNFAGKKTLIEIRNKGLITFDITIYSRAHSHGSGIVCNSSHHGEYIRGKKLSSASPVDCVRAAFPGGSMTGAPKLRSMELLDSLESSSRGIYSGCIGYFSYNQTFDLNIVIRTVVIHDGEASVRAGGAIVALSNPEEEYKEMLLKTRSSSQCSNGTSQQWKSEVEFFCIHGTIISPYILHHVHQI